MPLKQHLQLEWAYGYRGHQCRNNLHYNSQGHLVFFVAGVGIVQDTKEGVQRFYLEHSDDILCLSLDNTKTLAATGQIGKEPYICVWNTTTMKTISILRDLGHSGGVGIVAFSPDTKVFSGFLSYVKF